MFVVNTETNNKCVVCKGWIVKKENTWNNGQSTYSEHINYHCEECGLVYNHLQGEDDEV